METTIELRGMIEKESKNGRKYTQFQTNMGDMSCFENKVVDVLKTKIGQHVAVDLVDSNGFKNIRGLAGQTQAPKTTSMTTGDKFVEAREEKNKSIYTSYVKDLVVSGMKVDDAIAVIKKAIAAF